MSITGVLFDYGAVLTWPPTTSAGERLARVVGIPIDPFRERYFRERPAYDNGSVSDVEYWRLVTAGYPAERDTELLGRLIETDVEIWSQHNRATVDWLPALRSAGLRIGVLSNMPASFCDALERQNEWLELFHVRVFSGRVGMSKPDEAIFAHAIAQLGTSAESTLFLDDLEANVTAARDFGIKAEIYSVFTDGLTAIAERYGLPLPAEPDVPEHRANDMLFAPHRNV